MSLIHAANPGRHRLTERRDDLYETPPEAVRALLRVESLPESIWEPGCGPAASSESCGRPAAECVCHRSR
jgi:hypothetical protein